MVIYKITNIINNKIYIGQTNNFKQRKLQHINRSRYKHSPLYDDMRKYDIDNFKFEVIDKTDDNQQLNDLEQYYIKLYNSMESGYNIRAGGNVMHIKSHMLTHKASMNKQDVKERISKSLKQYRENNEFTVTHRQNLSKAMMGNHNFGDSDTRSIECWCIDDLGNKHQFPNYKEASKWWHNTYNPFHITYNYATYRRKIVDCINKGCCYFGREPNKIKVNNIQWFNK